MNPNLDILPTWAGAIIVIGAVVAAATGIIKGARGAYRMWRRVDRTIAEIVGEPADPEHGRDRVPSMGERVGHIEERVAEVRERVAGVEHEMHPNHGESLRDAVNRIDACVRGRGSSSSIDPQGRGR